MNEQLQHLLIGVYRHSFHLLRSGVFTEKAMCDEIKALFASGYSDGEVAQCLDVIVKAGDLEEIDLLDLGRGFTTGPRNPLGPAVKRVSA